MTIARVQARNLYWLHVRGSTTGEVGCLCNDCHHSFESPPFTLHLFLSLRTPFHGCSHCSEMWSTWGRRIQNWILRIILKVNLCKLARIERSDVKGNLQRWRLDHRCDHDLLQLGKSSLYWEQLACNAKGVAKTGFANGQKQNFRSNRTVLKMSFLMLE